MWRRISNDPRARGPIPKVVSGFADGAFSQNDGFFYPRSDHPYHTGYYSEDYDDYDDYDDNRPEYSNYSEFPEYIDYYTSDDEPDGI